MGGHVTKNVFIFQNLTLGLPLNNEAYKLPVHYNHNWSSCS